MGKSTNNISVSESETCCCIDVGSVIDNSDCTVSWCEYFADRANAEAILAQLVNKARQVESEPCQISANISDQANNVKLEITFNFACQAEAMVFELSLR